ncbi:MAG: YceH family protein [Verrucomicrobia bacterium]|nr:YceH family protein [Verrucomicrobiota bacterium]
MDDPLSILSAPEARVLGALIEKAITTPDYYPLSLNALTNACNQLSNREPVVAYDETTVVRALDSLRDKRLASLYAGAESRVARYKHTITDAILLTPAEVALLCVLLLRGPQTLGELRTRTERLFKFDTLPEVEEALNALATRAPQPLVAKLPRAPGTKESRYAHLLCGPVDAASPETPVAPVSGPVVAQVADDRVVALEQELAALRAELAGLRADFAAFRRQFD